MSKYVKGDYTKCYEDICEIWYEDNLYCIVRTDDADKIIRVLNENEQLKSDINLLTDQYNNIFEKNEQLKQFKEDVFNKIDMHLRMLPTARDNEFNEDDGDPSLYVGAIYMLETLKKELKE